jgi:Zn-finger protein
MHRKNAPLNKLWGALFFLLLPLSGFAVAADSVQSFLDRHWFRPIPPQGIAPKHFSDVEAALDPESCGTCHADQLADWKGSRHARAMDPGVLGQLLDMDQSNRGDHQDCLRCHAPLAEQADGLVAQMKGKNTNGLQQHGLICAACHVRNNERFGPPRRDGSSPQPGDFLPHNGFTASAAFQDSRFCASCHQFEPGDFSLNGKLLENTYEEWKSSRYGQEGKQCQSCHMPDRRHLWRGIHDAETVKNGVAVTSFMKITQGHVLGSLMIRNTAVGHYFPTYVTPMIYLDIFQEDRRGKVVAGTLSRHAIGRKVPPDISSEIFDTRLAPDAEHVHSYDRPLHPTTVSIVARVRVEPDAFYAGFYRSLLASGATRKGKALIRQALKQANASAFEIYLERYPVKH